MQAMGIFAEPVEKRFLPGAAAGVADLAAVNVILLVFEIRGFDAGGRGAGVPGPMRGGRGNRRCTARRKSEARCSQR